MNEEEPVEPLEALDGREVCEVCGKPQRDLRTHRRRQHPDEHAARKASRQFAAPRPRAGAGGGGKLPSLEQELLVTFAFAAQMWSMRDPYCANVAMHQAPAMAKAWDAWAQSSPSVHRAISMMMTGSGLIGVVLATMPVAIAIAAHHGPNRQEPSPEEQAAAAQAAGEEPAEEAELAYSYAGAGPAPGY